ncbi:hypothetical protein B0A48_10689 [Cryoendolithus antarcticus]|uniref:Amino acid permease/ SLC12A domain-containing protein n=1 Tax=Cryoendolithus antarcticus TaxID=1507870 RepID=A0A1V8SY10_9PEZI|nr:hypothetical protein B0A48_10689 [Cryoendolithus antarcticus]
MDFNAGYDHDEKQVSMATGAYEMQNAPKTNTHFRLQETNARTPEYQGADHTYNDQTDMRRLGKKQELRRNFRFTSILGFVAIAMGTWEVILSATAAGLTNGGTGGMIWMFVGSYICFGTIVLSLAEMSSMAPTAGGQYHWAFEFAPASQQKIISPKPWQGYLFVILMVTIGLAFNTILAKQLPWIEGVILVFHIFGWITVLIVLGILSPKNNATQVFTSFQNEGGWGSIGLSMLVGQVTSIYGLIGSDGAAHMAEETKNASMIVPRTMLWSYILNGGMGFAMLIMYCFCLTDVTSALDPSINRSGFPYIYVFQTGTGSTGGAVGLTSIILILGIAGATSFFASTSRQTFAFARDNGLPGSKWIGTVHPTLLIPLNAILVTYGFTILLSLITLGSTVAFNAIIYLQLLALMGTYAVSIGCVALKRLRGHPLPPSCWSLGKFGLPINVFAFTYACFATIFVCFPVYTPVTPQSMNWAMVMFTGVLVSAMIYYVVKGRKMYEGPVVFVQPIED